MKKPSCVGELAVWIEMERPKWVERGVDVLEDNGQTIFRLLLSSGKLELMGRVFVGTIEEVLRRPPVWEALVTLLVLGDGMSVEHAKVLIENAVDQVAGRVG